MDDVIEGGQAVSQASDKRRQIMQGAYRVFLRMGFDAASMNDITREAGVSKGTIYAYFKGKDELFEAVVEEERSRATGDLLECLDPGRPVAEVLVAFGTALALLAGRDDVVRAQRAVIAVSERMPDLGRRFFAEGPARIQKALAAYLEDAARTGTLALEDVNRAAGQFIDLASARLSREGLYNLPVERNREARAHRLAEDATTVFMAAYGAKKDR